MALHLNKCSFIPLEHHLIAHCIISVHLGHHTYMYLAVMYKQLYMDINISMTDLKWLKLLCLCQHYSFLRL